MISTNFQIDCLIYIKYSVSSGADQRVLTNTSKVEVINYISFIIHLSVFVINTHQSDLVSAIPRPRPHHAQLTRTASAVVADKNPNKLLEACPVLSPSQLFLLLHTDLLCFHGDNLQGSVPISSGVPVGVVRLAAGHNLYLTGATRPLNFV